MSISNAAEILDCNYYRLLSFIVKVELVSLLCEIRVWLHLIHIRLWSIADMPDFEEIASRDISGKGILKVPDAKSVDRAFILYADMIRPPKTAYKNFSFNPPKSLYARLLFLRAEYVVDERVMEYERQRFDFIPDICSETLLAVQCSYKGVLETFFNLGNALLLPSISIENKIEDYQRLKLNWTEVRVVCYADTGINLRLHSLAFDKCGDTPPPPPPAQPPPPPKPKKPVGEPFPNSPPYEPDSGSAGGNGYGDEGNTQPYEGDAPLPPDPCEGIGYWTIGYDATPGGANTTYFKGKADDTFTLEFVPTAGCRDGQSQALYSAGVLIYPGFTCTSRATLTSFLFTLGTPPAGISVEPNPRYAGC